MSRCFRKKEENFICAVCGLEVRGSGYTDHCPRCLWSRHLDRFPGDRLEACGGMMEPVGALYEKGKWRIFYRCQRCGAHRKCAAAKNDNAALIIEISKRQISLPCLKL